MNAAPFKVMQRSQPNAGLSFAAGGAGGSKSRLAWRIALSSAIVWWWSAAAHAEWLFDVDAGGRYDSNVNRAQQQPDVRADGSAALFASATSFVALTGADGLTAGASASTETWHRFHGLNLVSVGLGASYRHKFGVGLDVPWISLGLSASHDDYRSALRDSNRVEGRAEVGRRIDEMFDVSVGAIFDRRYARNDLPVVPGISGRVFDTSGKSAFARAGYAFTGQLQAGASFAVRRGSVVSTTRQHFDIFLQSDAIAADPTFGDEFFAYRLRGTSTTETAALTLSWALSSGSSLNVRYADERTSAPEGLDYRSRSAALSLTYSY
jgi:hypothetical protein